MILVEQWTSHPDYLEYNQWRSERGDLATLAELLQEPPKRRFFDFVSV